MLLFPGFLFAHKLEHGNLVVYSNDELTGSVEPVLDEVERRLATSEIDAPAISESETLRELLRDYHAGAL